MSSITKGSSIGTNHPFEPNTVAAPSVDHGTWAFDRGVTAAVEGPVGDPIAFRDLGDRQLAILVPAAQLDTGYDETDHLFD
jgi:hypothetical protein